MNIQFPLWNFWFWGSFALLLVVFEILAPSEFFLWFAVAALLTGLVSLLTPAWEWQLAAFSVLSVASITVAVYRLRRRPLQSDRPLLNRRGEALIGRTAKVHRAIPAGGRGEILVDGSLWLATADCDIDAGQRVRVTQADGALLRVSPANTPAQKSPL